MKREIIEIDLHYMRLWTATTYLLDVVNSAPTSVKEIIVIHGYNNGQSLQRMVRNDFRNPRVSKKICTTKGMTSLILN